MKKLLLLLLSCAILLSIIIIGTTNTSSVNQPESGIKLAESSSSSIASANSSSSGVASAKSSTSGIESAKSSSSGIESANISPSGIASANISPSGIASANSSSSGIALANTSPSGIKIAENSSNIYISTDELILPTSSYKEVKKATQSTKLLINRENALPKGYVPKNMATINKSKMSVASNDLKLLPVPLEALYQLNAAAKKDNAKGLFVHQAYRSESFQNTLFQRRLEKFKKTEKTYEEAFEKTQQMVAYPGKSEHQAGLALDVYSTKGPSAETFFGTNDQKWLEKNCYKFGYIVRYPDGKTNITKIIYEPWHIRYVGVPLATYLYNNKLCLEEFYTKLDKDKVIETDKYLFKKITSMQKVYINNNMKNTTELEEIKSGEYLLTVYK